MTNERTTILRIKVSDINFSEKDISDGFTSILF